MCEFVMMKEKERGVSCTIIEKGQDGTKIRRRIGRRAVHKQRGKRDTEVEPFGYGSEKKGVHRARIWTSHSSGKNQTESRLIPL
jgi:hypothetical protein